MLARLLLIIVPCLAAGCSGLFGGARPAPVETAAAVIQRLDAIGGVWPGYWSTQEAFLIYEPDGEAILYTTAPPPEGWEPNSAGTGFYNYEGTPPGLTGMFRTGYAVGDITATAVPQEKTVSGTLITLFHEAFHTFQEEQFSDHEIGFEYVEEIAFTPELAADAEVERRILSAALAATDPDEVRRLARGRRRTAPTEPEPASRSHRY